ncbi:MAG: HD domain-containing protein [Ignavibacteriales bacterium]|nr:HD domain-containing protein [Ignavibacteriales bacterium]
MDILDSEIFRNDYEKMKSISLNPINHTAANAYEHSELVQKRVIELAEQNDCTSEEKEILSNLARVHDIGKISGTANPAKSVEMLTRYGIVDDKFVSLVKYHDTNLPWFIATQKGQAPSDKAWRKLTSTINIKLLCIFMIADRIDCPGSWKANEALIWFLKETIKKQWLNEPLIVDDEFIEEI